MALGHSPQIVTNGLVFYYDMNNTQKSWKGWPVTNQFTLPTSDTNGFGVQNDTFYRIRTGNYGGYEIKPTDYVWKYNITNAGTCPYHGWDVSTTTGTVVVFSFDYYIDSSCSNYPVTNYLANIENAGFGGGGSVVDPTPTIKGVWKKAYMVSTATANGAARCLLYPGACGTRLADSGFILYKNPQVEFNPPGNVPSPFVSGTRSTTQALVDLTGNNTITANSLTYNSDGTFGFNGSNYGTISTFNNRPTTQITCESWIKPERSSVGTGTIRGAAISSSSSMYLGIIDSTDGGNTFSMHWANQTSNSRLYNWNGNIPNNSWSHLVGTYDGNTTRAYLNGVEIWSASQTGTITDGSYGIGYYVPNGLDGTHPFIGKLGICKIYNRALTSAEVKQNFNTLRGRYGI